MSIGRLYALIDTDTNRITDLSREELPGYEEVDREDPRVAMFKERRFATFDDDGEVAKLSRSMFEGAEVVEYDDPRVERAMGRAPTRKRVKRARDALLERAVPIVVERLITTTDLRTLDFSDLKQRLDEFDASNPMPEK